MKQLSPALEVLFDFGANEQDVSRETLDNGFLDFCQQSKSVRIALLGKPQQSARFSGEEVMLICGRTWPTADSVDNVRRSVSERKAYPLPEAEIPGGGKSFDAQGQTRKPGSHRDNRGHN